MLPQPLRNLGAIPLRDGCCSFRVWAPRCERLEVRLVAPGELLVPLQKGKAGYFQGVVAGVGPGARYFFRLDGAKDRPDPASRFQPEGVHGPSQVAAAGFTWEDRGWCGLEHQGLRHLRTPCRGLFTGRNAGRHYPSSGGTQGIGDHHAGTHARSPIPRESQLGL